MLPLKPRDGYDKWTMAGDLHHLVHNELGIDRPLSVVGHDLGSMVAFGYIVAVPQRCRQPDHYGSAAAWLAAQDKLATLSTHSRHRIVAEATQASLVLDETDAAAASQAIRDVVASVRTSRPLN